MPLFGSKKKDSGKMSAADKEKEANAMGHGSQQQPPPPPAYPTMGGGYPQQPAMGAAAAATMPGAPPPYVNVQQTVVVPNAFDAGARFGVGSQHVVPPPPPGIMPNAAQSAAAQGHRVVLGQRQQTFMEGTGDAGAVFW